MFERVTIFASDLEASMRFFRTVVPAIAGFEWRTLAIEQAEDDGSVTRRLHVGLRAGSHDEIDRFWQLGTDAGYRDDGPPGPRPQYLEDYYGAFLLDPDGNSIEAQLDGRGQAHVEIDHLWIRVRELPAAQRFYEDVAPHTGFALGAQVPPDRVHFRGAASSFALVAGDPTENAGLTFPSASGEAFTCRDPDGNVVVVEA